MVLLPCGRCCVTCTCNTCVCCECDGAIPTETKFTATDRWSRFSTGKLPTGTHTDLVDKSCYNLTDYTRGFTSRSYDRLVTLLPDCQIERRWSSQSACVDALIAAEVAAITAAGPPYTYDPWAGWCQIPTKVNESLTISATFGSGAAAKISDQSGCTIAAVTVTNGGSGYARLGRVAPTLTISGGGGTGATFTPSLSSSGSPATWSLSSATASGGSGYVSGSSLTITAAVGDTVVATATATVVARGEPTLTGAGTGGSGAELTVTLSGPTGSPPTWSVASVAVSKAGTGYTHNGAVTFTGGTVVTAATATAQTIEKPVYTVDASGAGGSGATFEVSFTQDTTIGTPRWYIDSITVVSGGSGYSADQTMLLVPDTSGDYIGGLFDENNNSRELLYTVSGGAITAITHVLEPFGGDILELSPGDLSAYRDLGRIQAVTVTAGGSYYGTTGAAYGVTVTSGGSYYREDKSATPDVATLTIYDSRGSGAAAGYAGVVDADTGSGTFGRLLSVTRTGGGFGGNPLAWTPTSSLSPDERQALMLIRCLGVASPAPPATAPSGFTGVFAPLANHEPIVFASLADATDAIEELYGAGGPLDAATLYLGYCSATTLATGTAFLPLGWTTPYRFDSPLTPPQIAALCEGGLPWKYQPDEDHPAVFTSWGGAIFATDGVPVVRSVTLAASTGDTAANRLLETGTQDKSVVEAELGSLPDYEKTVTTIRRETCGTKDPGDITGGNSGTSGEKELKIAVTRNVSGTPDKTWNLYVTLRPCSPPDDVSPGGAPTPYVSAYSVIRRDHATATDTDVTATLIADSSAFRPYVSQADCEAINARPDDQCAGGLWEQFQTRDAENTQRECCYGTATDDWSFEEL